jgi:transglutaminase-like putative cysteine protease
VRGSIFKTRAIEEGLRYGKDRWVFLRELAQNARDAGARRIRVRTALEDGELMVSFEDDGEGMAYEHAREYLFCLYASNKEDNQSSAGKFGVGFWSVLLFEPSSIFIESRPRQGDAWAVQLDGDLNEISHQPSDLDVFGTRVILRKPNREATDPAEMAHQVRAALSQYCRHLRRNDREATPLPVEVNGANISEDLSTGGTVQIRFRKKRVEGAVGLGETPLVELYSRGLLVWRGTLLDELRYGAPEGDGRQFPPGLAPVYVLNGHRLNVTLDRRAVIDDRRLTEVRVVARRAMRNLLHGYLDKLSPRSSWQKLRDGLLGIWEDADQYGHKPWIRGFGAAAVAVIALLFVLPRLFGSDPLAWFVSERTQTSPASQSAPLVWPMAFHGVGVEPSQTPFRLQLAYQPSDRAHAFRTISLVRLHPGMGFEQEPLASVADALPLRCESDCLDVAVTVNIAAGQFPLPVPSGYSVEPTSVRLNGKPAGQLRVTIFGDPVLHGQAPMRGTLTYRAGPGQFLLSPVALESMLDIPPQMEMPGELQALAARAKVGWSPGSRAQWLANRIEKMIAYDTSPQVVANFSQWRTERPRKGFLDFVWRIRRGDCDVKNTVLVATLRKAEVPARLALGFLAEAGTTLPGLHAWVETHVEDWTTLDASGTPPIDGDSNRRRSSPPVLVVNKPPKNAVTENSDEPVHPSPADLGVASAEEEPFEPSPTPLGGSTPAGLESTVVLSPPPETDRFRLVALAFGFLSLLLAAVAFILAAANRQGIAIETAVGAGSPEEIAARMLEGAVFRPDLWTNARDLARRELLPIKGEKSRMTLNEIVARREKGALWSASEEGEVTAQALRRGLRILDGGHEVFGDLVRRLPGCVNLDELDRLEVVDPSSCPPELVPTQRLVERANILLEEAGLETGLLRLCATGSLFPIRDIDLRKLRVAKRGVEKSAFVAVIADRPHILKLSKLFKSSPELAAYALVELAAVESALLRPLRPWLRIRAATSLCDLAGGAT